MATWKKIVVEGSTGNITQNAATATALQTARNFSIGGGQISAPSVSFDGGANVQLNAAIAADAIDSSMLQTNNNPANGKVLKIILDGTTLSWENDENTTYSANDGITLSGTTFSADSTVVRTTGNYTMAGTLTVANLTVNGTTTSIDSINLNVKDQLISAASNVAYSAIGASGAGIYIGNSETNAPKNIWQAGATYFSGWKITNGGSSDEFDVVAAYVHPNSAPSVNDNIGKKGMLWFNCSTAELYLKTQDGAPV